MYDTDAEIDEMYGYGITQQYDTFTYDLHTNSVSKNTEHLALTKDTSSSLYKPWTLPVPDFQTRFTPKLSITAPTTILHTELNPHTRTELASLLIDGRIQLVDLALMQPTTIITPSKHTPSDSMYTS